jgi:hypothetical protein
MVQYVVLARASKHGGLGRWTDVMRLLDELESAGLVPEPEVEALNVLTWLFEVSFIMVGLALIQILSACSVIVRKYTAFGLPAWKPVITKTIK